jgi:hypothetical protein
MCFRRQVILIDHVVLLDVVRRTAVKAALTLDTIATTALCVIDERGWMR